MSSDNIVNSRPVWRLVRVVEGARLESVYTGNCIEGSNPSVSAMYYVYILQSLKDFSYYIGQCDDLDRRMSKHFDGFSKYTSGKRPWRLKYFEAYTNRSEAIKREKQLKGYKNRIYLESIIQNWYRSISCPSG